MKLLATLIVCATVSFIEARVQSVGVRGTLKCGNGSLENTVVKLWDEDSWFDPDDPLGCVKPDKQGSFEVQGYTDEYSNIDPELKIYTDCNDLMLWGYSEKPCQRKIKMEIPESYINSGDTVTRWLDIGVINLEVKQDDEDRKCSMFEIC